MSEWLATPARTTSGYRDDFFLKLAAARRLADPDLVRQVLDTRRGLLLQELRDLAALPRGASTYDDLLTTAAELQTQGHLRLLDEIEAVIPALIEEAKAGTDVEEAADTRDAHAG